METARKEDVTKRGRPAFWVALIIGTPLSMLLLWLTVRHADLEAVWDAVASAELWPLIVAVVVLGFLYVLQGFRWRVIVGLNRPSGQRYVELLVAGIACNNLLPGRIGDLLRARCVAVDADMPSGRGLASVVLDKGFDIVALVLFLCVSLPTVTSEAWIARIAVGASVVLAVLVIGLLFARIYTRARERERRRRGIVRGLIRDTLEGLAQPIGRRRFARALVLSVVAWCIWAAAAMLVATAVGIDLRPVDALFVAAVVNLGLVVPSSPGYVGTYQWLGVQALGVLGVAREEALAFSIVLHATWYLPTTVVGVCILATRVDWNAVRGRRGPSPSVGDASTCGGETPGR